MKPTNISDRQKLINQMFNENYPGVQIIIDEFLDSMPNENYLITLMQQCIDRLKNK